MSIGPPRRILLIAIPVVLLSFALVCVMVLNSNAFRGFLRSEIRQQAMQHWGLPVDIGAVETHWSRLRLELKDIVVHGTQDEAANEPAPLRAQSLLVSIRLLPLLHGKVRLRELVLERPEVHLRVDSQGRSNLVIANNSGARSTSDTAGKVFDLEAENCAIQNGQFFYNDIQTPLDAEVHDLQFHAGYSILKHKYIGSLSYGNGRLATAKIRPVAHAVQLQFAADRSGLSLSPLNLTIGSASRLTLDARISNYEQPKVEGNYRGNLLLQDISRALQSDAIPSGEIALLGRLAYDSTIGKPFLAAVELQGNATSAGLVLPASERRLAVSDVSAAYNLKDANLSVTNISAAILGGQARGKCEVLGLDLPQSAERLEASLSGVSLRRASDALAPPDVQRIPVVGTANLDVNASWAGSLDNAIARLRLAISSPQQARSSHAMIPVNGLVQADYDGPRNVVSFGHSYLQTRSTKLSIAGTLSPRTSGNSNVFVSLTASDLREVNSLATLTENASSHNSSSSLPELGGSASFQGTITGTPKNPRIEGQLSAQNLAVDQSRWKALSLNLQAQPSAVKIQNGMLAEEPQGEITFDANAALQHWALPANARIAAHAKVTNVSIADAQEIAHLHYPVTGTVAATVSVEGTRENPAANATLTLTGASAWKEQIQKLSLDVKLTNGGVQSTTSLEIPAGTVSADGTYKLETQQYTVQVHGDRLHLDKISALDRLTSVGGVAAISASGSGTIQNPSLQANLTIPQLQIRDQNISDITAQIGVANRHANLTMHSNVYNGAVEARGDIDLTGNRYTTASVDIRTLPLAPVMAAFLPTQEAKVSGQTEIHLRVQGPLDTPAQMQAHLEIPTLNLAYEKVQLALAQPLRSDYRDGEIILAPTRIQGTGTNLTLGGTIPVRNASAAYSLSADGSMDLSVFQQFAPDVHSAGQLILNVRSNGTSLSGMHGRFQVKNAVFSTDSLPVGIEDLNAQIDLSGTRADITKFSGQAGGGEISARGFFNYGREPNFSLALNAKSVRIRYPEGLRSVLSGQINAQGTPTASSLTGRVLVDRMSFTQAFDLANFSDFFSQASGGATPSPFERGMQMNVAVQSAQSLNLTSSKVSVAGSASLMVKGTLANPVVLGRVALTSGEVFFLSKRFEVQNGTIAFANAARTEPLLNLYVETKVEQYDVKLHLAGPVDRLKTTYTSDPGLPQADIIHLLAFGNTTEEAAASPSQTVGQSAQSILAQGVSSQVAGKIENLAGISQLTIDPLAANNGANPGAQVTIQQRVTGSLLLTFSTDVTTTQAQTVQVQYQLNKRWSVTVLRDQYGGYGVDVRLHKEF